VGPPCLPTTHITPHESHHSSSPLLLRQQPHSYRSSSAVFCRDSTWPHFRACHWNFQHTHEDKRLISHLEWQITDLQGRKTSPSVPLRDSTWPHFRACHWSFQHTYEDKRLIPDLEWRITDLQGRKIIPAVDMNRTFLNRFELNRIEFESNRAHVTTNWPTRIFDSIRKYSKY